MVKDTLTKLCIARYISLVKKILFYSAKPQVSLTAPNHDNFVRVSLKVLDNFLDAIAKAKKLIRESISQNLKRVSLTKSFLALAMAFNLLPSNPT